MAIMTNVTSVIGAMIMLFYDFYAARRKASL